jgi:hypothetical protein
MIRLEILLLKNVFHLFCSALGQCVGGTLVALACVCARVRVRVRVLGWLGFIGAIASVAACMKSNKVLYLIEMIG